MRLIDADRIQALFKKTSSALLSDPYLTKDSEHVLRALLMTSMMLFDAPTVDAEPVKHGHWIEKHEVFGYIICSNCNHEWCIADNDTETFDYCPHCGAQMDAEEENETN